MSYVKRHFGGRRHVGEMSVTREAVACYRLYAANCIELAKNIADPDRRVFLFNMARDWFRLADQAERNEMPERAANNPAVEARLELPDR